MAHSISDYGIKSVKCFATFDGGGFNATITQNGKPIAFVLDGGNGGGLEYQIKNADALSDLAVRLLGAQSLNECDGVLDQWVCEQIDKDANDKWIKRQLKTKTLFRLPSDAPNQFRQILKPRTPQIDAFIMAKYPNAVIVEVAR